MRHHQKGFTLIEAIISILIIGVAFMGFGYVLSNMDQNSLTADLSVVATELARDKMEELVAQKANSGYAAVSSQAAQNITQGTWSFSRDVVVSYVDSNTLSSSGFDTGYKKVVVNVSWGAGTGSTVSLQTLLTNQVPP